VVHAWAEKAGLRPEKERPGLLLPQSPHDTQSARRRPADVFLPALAGGPAALDFAITGTSGRTLLLWPAAGQVLPRRRMTDRRRPIYTLRRLVPRKGSPSFPWSSKPLDIGMLARPGCCAI
jgi:hypothetical protein